ncbi:falcilysin, putative [Theileria annulata]|uniref:Falcilysin, putative n=1 Tax=Theileria annulata TaxID=5874 RepID=Q4UDW3_THEAN|nr:falcilysin, putative [Theileria annulata]CAI74726.1 falcilysin, putative [Theileria annulata]|eukprot:XP_952458.1 falcilysin, putative [Theileria annulata]
MLFFHRRTLSRRHHMLTITSASILSYVYCNLFIRNSHTQALSKFKYYRIASVFDSNSKCPISLRNHFNDRYYLFIRRLYSSSPANNVEDVLYKVFSPDSFSETTFRHSILNMKFPDQADEPEWVQESKSFNHPSFEKIGSVYLPDIGVVASNYKHKLSGLSVFSLKSHIDSGKEMCFDLIVPSPPLNSKGSPHVLEHSVLSGTPKYPMKDPFSLLVQGGFNSFLNAMTYKDRTSYLFASTNEKSFYQTGDVYMDSFFRPNITKDKTIFEQECWHYKVTDGTSDKSDADVPLHGRMIGYSGVVYSEMKNRFSDSSCLFYNLIYQNLFSNSYKYVSGGDPSDIVDLTHQELVNFYKLYYGPKTATLYFYGPYDVQNRLDFVDKYLTTYNIGIEKDPNNENLVHNASLLSSDSNLPYEEYKSKPKHVSSEYSSVDPTEDELMISWLLDPLYNGSMDKFKIDPVDNVGFQVLQYLLLGTPESVLYKGLIDSGLGKKVLVHGFLSGYKQSLFSFGLKGVDNTKHNSKDEIVRKFEEVVFGILNKITEEGFKRDAIDSGLNLVEFEMRELNSGSYPKGLMLIDLIQSQLQYGKDPFGLLRFDSLMKELRSRIFSDNPSNYFINLIVKHMLNNNTRVTVHLQAVEASKYEKEFNKKIADQLRERLSHLSKEQVDEMEEYYKKFKAEREDMDINDGSESLKTLELSDISREQETIPTKFYKLSSDGLSESNALYNDGKTFTVLTHPIDSHGVLYMDYALSLDSLTVDDLCYLNLFSSMLKESGTDKLTPEELTYKIDKNLGGLSLSTYFTTETNNKTYDDPEDGLGYLIVRAKCLKHKVNEMLEVVNEVLLNADFSNSKKGLEILKRALSMYQANVSSKGNEFALRRMCAKFSVSDYADELVNGYSQLVFLRDTLVPLAEKDWSKVESKLNEMRVKLLSMKNLTVNLGGDSELLDSVLDDSTTFYSKLSSTFKYGSKTSDKVWVKEVLDKKLMDSVDKNELIVVPSRVNFVGMGGKLFDKNDEVLGSNSLAVHYLSRKHLFTFVRMSLGAYSVYSYLLNTGHIIFMSYADPNFEKTLEVYRNLASVMKEAYEKIEDSELLRQKIGKISGLDKPLHVENKTEVALRRALRKESDEFRQKFREDVIDSTKECFNRLYKQMTDQKEWNNVSAVVNSNTSDEAPSDYKRLQIN